MKRCAVGIRRPENTGAVVNGTDASTVCFPSMAPTAAVLSEEKRILLHSIRDAKPKTLKTELAGTFGATGAECVAHIADDGRLRLLDVEAKHVK